jgi:DNA-directed RNA polymerase alpha subunit
MSDLAFEREHQTDASYFVEQEATFYFPNASMKRVNSIRRAILTKLDVAAIDLSYVLVNTSS